MQGYPVTNGYKIFEPEFDATRHKKYMKTRTNKYVSLYLKIITRKYLIADDFYESGFKDIALTIERIKRRGKYDFNYKNGKYIKNSHPVTGGR